MLCIGNRLGRLGLHYPWMWLSPSGSNLTFIVHDSMIDDMDGCWPIATLHVMEYHCMEPFEFWNAFAPVSHNVNNLIGPKRNLPLDRFTALSR